MKKVLIIIDCQNDFCKEGGALANKECIKAVDDLCENFNRIWDRDTEVFVTRDTHFRNSYLNTVEGKHLPILHCIQDSAGWCLRDDLAAKLDKLDIKYSYVDKNTFGYNNWKGIIGPIPYDGIEISLVGVCTDICVVTNALLLKTQYPEAEISVYTAYTAGTSVEAHEAAIKTMKSCHINCI